MFVREKSNLGSDTALAHARADPAPEAIGVSHLQAVIGGVTDTTERDLVFGPLRMDLGRALAATYALMFHMMHVGCAPHVAALTHRHIGIAGTNSH
jgi:hypothetical protein